MLPASGVIEAARGARGRARARGGGKSLVPSPSSWDGIGPGVPRYPVPSVGSSCAVWVSVMYPVPLSDRPAEPALGRVQDVVLVVPCPPPSPSESLDCGRKNLRPLDSWPLGSGIARDPVYDGPDHEAVGPR